MQSIHHKNYVKKVIQISQNNLHLYLLGIEDQNIKVLNIKSILKPNKQIKLIQATLSYPMIHCKKTVIHTCYQV